MAGKKRLSNAAYVRKKTKVSVPRLRRALKLQIPEQKFFDSSGNMNPTNTWQYMSFLANIVQGTTQTASVRIGNKIFVKYIDVITYMLPTITATKVQGSICRTAVVHRKECNNTAIGVGDVWLVPGPSAVAIFSQRNTSKMPAFAVSRDTMETFVPTAATGVNTVVAMAPVSVRKFRIKVNKTISYSASSPNVTDLVKDDYGIMCCAQDAVSCSMDVYWKVVFTDA